MFSFYLYCAHRVLHVLSPSLPTRRASELIDKLLATPLVYAPIKLVRPNVMYTFADPELESLSFGQKTLIRLGPEGEQTVKDKLRAIRTEIIARAKQPGSPEVGKP